MLLSFLIIRLRKQALFLLPPAYYNKQLKTLYKINNGNETVVRSLIMIKAKISLSLLNLLCLPCSVLSALYPFLRWALAGRWKSCNLLQLPWLGLTVFCTLLLAWAGCPVAASKLPKWARLLPQQYLLGSSSSSCLPHEVVLGPVAMVLFWAVLIRTWEIVFLFHEPNSSFLCFFLSFSFLPGMKQMFWCCSFKHRNQTNV